MSTWGVSGKLESSNLGRDNLSMEIGRTLLVLFVIVQVFVFVLV